MLYYLSQLNTEELHDLFICETNRFIEGLEKNLPHKDMAAIRRIIKQILVELEKRKKVNS